MSLLPYEDPSASYQRQLKTKRRQQAAEDTSQAADDEEAVGKAISDAAVEAGPGKDPVTHVREVSASAGATFTAETAAATTQTAQETTAPPSDSPKKD